jgi:hypothetical protein
MSLTSAARKRIKRWRCPGRPMRAEDAICDVLELLECQPKRVRDFGLALIEHESPLPQEGVYPISDWPRFGGASLSRCRSLREPVPLETRCARNDRGQHHGDGLPSTSRG